MTGSTAASSAELGPARASIPEALLKKLTHPRSTVRKSERPQSSPNFSSFGTGTPSGAATLLANNVGRVGYWAKPEDARGFGLLWGPG